MPDLLVGLDGVDFLLTIGVTIVVFSQVVQAIRTISFPAPGETEK